MNCGPLSYSFQSLRCLCLKFQVQLLIPNKVLYPSIDTTVRSQTFASQNKVLTIIWYRYCIRVNAEGWQGVSSVFFRDPVVCSSFWSNFYWYCFTFDWCRVKNNWTTDSLYRLVSWFRPFWFSRLFTHFKLSTYYQHNLILNDNY